ncbi:MULTISPECIES: site-specific integrase [unclassified Sulfitobacter]|jgi:hypothetical protein|uniref:site-specific integrase n=1 Tax=unclassified Sulfitobacter TaxID=196795 RepID=UPI0004E2B81C|nr:MULTISPECIES: site-specific integrase [unclassified Sulfitobacter]PTA98899.1 site-specific integrase [Sulfitobacter sp. CB-A]ULO18981.1 site-specific integrase [Sulfitobacter sp. CB2047]
MKTLERIGQFTVAQNRNTYHLRWTNKNTGKQESESFGRDRARAEGEAWRRMAALVSPGDLIERPNNPTFEELWHFYCREKKPNLSVGRVRRLDEAYKLYFKSALSKVPASELPDAIRMMRDRMLDGWTGDNRDNSRGARHRPIHPNTIEDVVNIARATLNFLLDERIIAGPSPVPTIRVAGRTAPIDRDPKGRHLSFSEIGKLIDACEFRHHLHIMLFELGCGARSGVFTPMWLDQVLWDVDAINTLPEGWKQGKKYRPVVPVTGPMRWAAAEATMTAGPDQQLIHYRSEGLKGRNGTQIIHRIAKRALGEEKAENVNWYSIRHTLIDWLEMRVPAKSLSILAGHVAALDTRERRQMRNIDGSKTTLIYMRAKLAHFDPVRKALDEEWWPAIQMHCDLNLRLDDPKVDYEWATARELAKKIDANQMQLSRKWLKENNR